MFLVVSHSGYGILQTPGSERSSAPHATNAQTKFKCPLIQIPSQRGFSISRPSLINLQTTQRYQDPTTLRQRISSLTKLETFTIPITSVSTSLIAGRERCFSNRDANRSMVIGKTESHTHWIFTRTTINRSTMGCTICTSTLKSTLQQRFPKFIGKP